MLDNIKLNRRLKRIIKDLKERWGITPYRIAVESDIPHSSLKYMLDGKFEWKLNHLLSFVDFLNRNRCNVSLRDLLDFDEKKALNEILDVENADFRQVVYAGREGYEDFTTKELQVKISKSSKKDDFIQEADSLTNDLSEIIKESSIFKTSKISMSIKLTGRSAEFSKEYRFVNGKESKN